MCNTRQEAGEVGGTGMTSTVCSFPARSRSLAGVQRSCHYIAPHGSSGTHEEERASVARKTGKASETRVNLRLGRRAGPITTPRDRSLAEKPPSETVGDDE